MKKDITDGLIVTSNMHKMIHIWRGTPLREHTSISTPPSWAFCNSISVPVAVDIAATIYYLLCISFQYFLRVLVCMINYII